MVEDAPASVWPLWEPAGIPSNEQLHEQQLLHEKVHLFTLVAMEMIQVFFFYFYFCFFGTFGCLFVLFLFLFANFFFPLEDPPLLSNGLNTS